MQMYEKEKKKLAESCVLRESLLVSGVVGRGGGVSQIHTFAYISTLIY